MVKLKSALLCASSIGLVLAGSAHAQTVPTTEKPRPGEEAPAEDSPDGDRAEDANTIVVTGFRASLDQAIDLKRDSTALRDSIVAEDIGRFPEANIAESLQRIPGVELERDGASNEGQTIRLRGLPSNFTITTFNGSPVYTTSGAGVGTASRTFNYDVFPSELFGRVDVYKSPLAELAEGGIAGVVDLQTPRPFDQKQELTGRYSLTLNNNSQSGENNPRGNALISARSGNFGALISIAGARTTNGRAGFQSTGTYSASSTNAADRNGGAIPSPLAGNIIGNNFNYNFNAPGINLNGATQQQIRDAILPRFLLVQVARNVRERLGASASLQYKTDRLDISLDGLYSVVKDDDQVADVRWPIRDSINALALVPLDVRVDDNNNLQGTLGNVQFFYGSTFNRTETKYKYLALNAAYQMSDRLKVSGQVAISDSQAFRNTINLSGDARQARQTITFDTTDPLFPSITTTSDLLNPATYFTNTGPAYAGGYREEEDNLKSGRLVLDWDYEIGDVEAHLKAGFTYNENSKVLEVRATNNIYNTLTIPNVGAYNAPTTTLAQRNAFITSFLRPLRTADFVPGAPDSLPQEFLAFDKDFAYNTLGSVDANRAARFNLGNTYEAIETIKAFFIQSDFSGDLFGRRMRVNAGVRYVDTRTDINNFLLAGGGNFVPDSRSGGYSKWLPSFTLAYDLTDKLVLRAAVGKTFTRAAIQSIAASVSVPAAGNPQVNIGNPDLRPEVATGIDGAVEWYFAPGGVLSLAAYRKKISDRALQISSFVPFSTLGIPASLFTINIQNDIAAGLDLFELRTPVNLDTYTLDGIEIAYQQQFKFLPAPFDGLGMLASFTRVSTQGLSRLYPATQAANPLLPQVDFKLNDVPDTTYQISGYYEKGPVSFRVAYNYKSEVANVNQFSTQNIGFQRFQNSRGYLDATASYAFAPWLELRIDALNITNTQTFDFFRNVNDQFGDEKSRIEQGVQNGRVIQVGIRGRF